jgi:hypothetical protein
MVTIPPAIIKILGHSLTGPQTKNPISPRSHGENQNLEITGLRGGGKSSRSAKSLMDSNAEGRRENLKKELRLASILKASANHVLNPLICSSAHVLKSLKSRCIWGSR